MAKEPKVRKRWAVYYFLILLLILGGVFIEGLDLDPVSKWIGRLLVFALVFFVLYLLETKPSWA